MMRNLPGRIPLVVVMAICINVLLFTAIEYMVGLRQLRLTDTTDIKIANFIRMSEPSRMVRSRRDPKAPQKPAKEVQQDIERLAQARSAGIAGMTVTMPDIETEVDLGADIQLARELTPLVRIPPDYPRAAISKRIEGYVLLRFTVTETGTVANPEVLRAEPPGVFDRAARRAVLKWKYQPQFVGGEPVSVVTYARLTFELLEAP